MAYHPLIVDVARDLHGDVLDVGCGDGLLIERLAPVSRTVRGVDPDERAIERARARITGLPNARASVGDFMAIDLDPLAYDLVTMVATLHHLDLKPALERVRSILRPGGKLVVVGLSANESFSDYAWSALTFPAVRILSRFHGEHRDIGVTTLVPRQSLREIRQDVCLLLPSSSLRRGIYYRYILTWTKTS